MDLMSNILSIKADITESFEDELISSIFDIKNKYGFDVLIERKARALGVHLFNKFLNNKNLEESLSTKLINSQNLCLNYKDQLVTLELITKIAQDFAMQHGDIK